MAGEEIVSSTTDHHPCTHWLVRVQRRDVPSHARSLAAPVAARSAQATGSADVDGPERRYPGRPPAQPQETSRCRSLLMSFAHTMEAIYKRLSLLRDSERARSALRNSLYGGAEYVAMPLTLLLATPFLLHRLGPPRY